ncbi:unnamed protein product, partial [Onchocerca ochengi]|uniref:SH2 domain-containing protein n=1 Tax=Onchocerca ochengi TaxID=42157 RepID=A0A182EQ51_ONCOC
NDKSVKPEELPYFHDEPINVLTQRLIQYGVGCYLLRHSIVQSNSYTLMVNTGAHIEKFQIKRTSDGDFEIGGRIFATIPDIIERYSEKEICEGFHLMRAVLASTFERDLSGKNVDKKFQNLITSSFYPQTILASYAYRKCKEDRWKRCYVKLNDSDGSQLYVFDHEKRTKPKVVLDLSFCFVYKIPEGSFDRANCLLIAPNGLDVYPSLVHLSFQNEGIYLNWLNMLRLRCFGYQHSPSPFAVIPAVQDYFFRTTTIIYLNLISFRYIPPGPCSLELQLCSHNPDKDADANRHELIRTRTFKDHLQKNISPLYVLDDGKELCMEDNFEGFMFRAVRHRIVLLPEEQYASFFVLLTTRSFILSTWIGSVLDIFNRKYFARLLLSVLLPNYDLLMSFVEVIVREQIGRETGLCFLNLYIYKIIENVGILTSVVQKLVYIQKRIGTHKDLLCS